MNVPAPSPFPSLSTHCEHQFDRQQYKKANNNGLDRAVSNLEKIYTTHDWPSKAEKMPSGLSLFQTGKSRADLWQFAALVALENILERSDFACRHDNWERQQVTRNAQLAT